MTRRALPIAMVIAAVVGHAACASSPAASTRVTLVVGAGDGCADDVSGVHVTVKDGDRTTLTRDFAVHGSADLPVSLEVSSSTAQTAVAIFDVEGGPLLSDAHPAITVALPAGTTGRVPLMLACGCISFVCVEGQTCAELPEGSGQVACVSPSTCGNGLCEAGEGHVSCPSDCPAACGDGVCDGGEDCASCALDCGACCGDGLCDHGETCKSCKQDCGACPVCGDHVCQKPESCSSCPGDCPCQCGDGQCAGTESCATCVTDCGYCPPTCEFHVSPTSGGQETYFSISLTSSYTESCDVSLDGQLLGTLMPCLYDPDPLPGSALPTGAHALDVVAHGHGKALGACSASFTVYPRASCSLGVTPEAVCQNASATVDLTVADATSCQLVVDGGPATDFGCTTISGTPMAASGFALGPHSATILVDGPGGAGSCSKDFSVTSTTCEVVIVDNGGCSGEVHFITNGASCTAAVDDPTKTSPIDCAVPAPFSGLSPGSYTVYLNVGSGPCGPTSCSKTVTLSC